MDNFFLKKGAEIDDCNLLLNNFLKYSKVFIK